VDFLEVRLDAPTEALPALTDFYGTTLGFGVEHGALAIGVARLEFQGSDGEPFYHFALLAPGNRFEAMLEWAAGRTELLPDPETGDAVFDFTNWDAQACYFHDPAGNIFELIAHRGVGEADATGPFEAHEVLGFSELGLVGDPRAMAAELSDLGLELWDGTLDEPGRLAFVGEKARTLILSPPGRGWLPTGREAEAHAVDVLLSSGRYTLRR
jgi:catechol 2,3-dioxygenase-like lactoylglutathione lyase family enzyme